MADEITRQVTVTLASQTATLTPKAGTTGHPDHLNITGGTIILSANAASFFNTLDEYEIRIQRRTRT
jgi:hypothetical protein